MTTEQMLFILQRNYEDDLVIEALETGYPMGESEYTAYEAVVFLKSELHKELEPDGWAEYVEEGIACCLSAHCIYYGETLKEALQQFIDDRRHTELL